MCFEFYSIVECGYFRKCVQRMVEKKERERERQNLEPVLRSISIRDTGRPSVSRKLNNKTRGGIFSCVTLSSNSKRIVQPSPGVSINFSRSTIVRLEHGEEFEFHVLEQVSRACRIFPRDSQFSPGVEEFSFSTLFLSRFRRGVPAVHGVYTCHAKRIPRPYPFIIQLSFIINVIRRRVSLAACQEFISSEERLRSLYTKFWIQPALAAFPPRV